MAENKNNIITKFSNNKLYVFYSFFIASILMFLYYVVGGMVFGNYVVMRSDLISGIIGGIKESMRNIINGDNIWFSFSTCLGMDNALSVSSCLFSPFNILYLIFYKLDENFVTALVVILKVGCIAASFSFFNKKVLNNNSFSGVVISVFYALCAYTIAYGTIQICWLDALLILPLLIFSIIECISKDKRILMTILYVYLFVSQFYMGYMVGFFSLFFVVVYSFVIYKNENDIKIIFKKLFNWFLGVVIAVMISAVVWVPTLFFLLANRAEDSSGITTIDFSLLQILNSLFWGNGYGIEGRYSYIYCGVPILILVPLYFMNKKINKKEKILAASLLAFLACCTILTPLNTFMHVFDQPDMFWYRYSFIISFMLCCVASRQLTMMNDFKYKTVFYVIVAWMIFYLLELQGISIWALDGSYRPTHNNNSSFVFNMLFLLFWVLVYYLYAEKKKIILSTILCTLLMGVEIVTSTIPETSIKENSTDYYEWYNYMSGVTAEINRDNDLYRTLCNNNKYINSDTWFGYNGFSDLGSEEKLPVRNALSNLGFSTSTRFIDDGGHTPVSEMILGVKYIINRPYSMIDYEDNVITEDNRYYTNDYYLGIGYLVNGSTGLYEWDGRNVFENMNTLVSSMTGDERECFFKIPEDKLQYDLIDMEQKSNSDGSGKLIRTDDSGQLYITVFNDNYDKAYVQLETTDVGNYGYDFFLMGAKNAGNIIYNNAKLSAATEMYYDKEKDKYNVFFISNYDTSPDKLEYDAINVYGLDSKVLEEQYGILNSGRYIVDKWSNGHIEGHVSNNGERNLLFLSVPYDPGWSVKINGLDGEIVRVLDGAFMAVFLPGEGEYNITFDYECPGLKIGMIVSLCGLLAFMSVLFEKKLNKKTT